MLNKVALEKEEIVYQTLRDRIFSGFYWPKQRLLEGTLSEELNVKRFVIREVLKRLAAEGLVVSQRYRGSFVAEVSAQEAFETYEVQSFLEGAAAYLATQHIKKNDIRKISRLISKCRKLDSKNMEEWANYNRQIHRITNKACGNDKLIALIRDNVKFMKYWFIVLSNQAEITNRNQEHELILEALKQKDPDKVRKAVEDHIIGAGRDMLKRLEVILPRFSSKSPSKFQTS